MKTTENKTSEPKLIYFDQDEYSRQLRDFQENLTILNEIVDAYGSIFTDKITVERINQIFSSDFKSLREAALLVESKAALSRTHFEVVQQHTMERLDEFEAQATRLVSRFKRSSQRQAFATLTPIEWYAIDPDGKFFIPDTTLEAIRSRCSNYIEGEEQQHIFDLLQKLADLNNEIFRSLGPRAKAEIDTSSEHRHSIIATLLTADLKGHTIPDPGNNYSYLTK